MKEQEQKMKLPKLDDLFTTQAERDFENARARVVFPTPGISSRSI